MLVSAAGIARHAFVLDPPALFPPSFSNKIQHVNFDGTFNFVRVFGQDLLSDYDEALEVSQARNGTLASSDQSSQLRVEGKPPSRNNWGGHILLIGSGAAYTPYVILHNTAADRKLRAVSSPVLTTGSLCFATP